MKKLVAMLLSLSMIACLFAGCGGGTSSAATSDQTSQPVAEESQKAPEQSQAPAASETEPASEAEASIVDEPTVEQGLVRSQVLYPAELRTHIRLCCNSSLQR